MRYFISSTNTPIILSDIGKVVETRKNGPVALGDRESATSMTLQFYIKEGLVIDVTSLVLAKQPMPVAAFEERRQRQRIQREQERLAREQRREEELEERRQLERDCREEDQRRVVANAISATNFNDLSDTINVIRTGETEDPVVQESEKSAYTPGTRRISIMKKV